MPERRTNASVKDHDRHIWLHGFADLHHLLEEFRLLLVSTRRIHNDDIEPFLLEFGNTLRCDGDRIRLSVRTEVGDLCLRRGLTSLVESTGTEGIRTDNT